MKKIIIALVLLFTTLRSFAMLPTATIAPMLKKVMPAVVNIRVQGEILVPSLLPKGQMHHEPLPPHAQRIQQLGSGVIVDAKDGYIITNAHVVKNEKSIMVTLSDSRQFPAKLIGEDTASDIAVLRIQASNLHSIPLGDSDKLQVGDFVAAIGSPFGLNQTITAGVVSALQRSNLHIEGLEDFIQTDAAINPGNSGGALVTFNGKLVGINTAIVAPAGGNVGIGFSIPINMAKTVMLQLIKYGEVRRGLLGVFVQPLTPALAQAFNIPPKTQGGIVTSVAPNSAALKAGLKSGDIIVEINGNRIHNASQIRNMVGLMRIGSKLDIEIIRQGKRLTKHAIISDSKSQANAIMQAMPFLNGVSLTQINESQSRNHGDISGGVQVLAITPDSPAEKAGLMPGDIIVSANHTPIKTLRNLKRAVKKQKNYLLLNILRGPGALFIIIK